MRVAVVATVLLFASAALAAGAAPRHTMLEVFDIGSGSVVATDPSGAGSLEISRGGSDPSWSPDGTQVALIAPSQPPSYGSDDVWVVTIGDTGYESRQLTFTRDAFRYPVWSPDGTTIAYLRKGSEVWLVPAAGGTPRRLTAPGLTKDNLAWQPHGNLLLYGERGGTTDHVVLTNATTGVTRAIATGSEPVWSPDGTRIAFVDSSDHIAVMNADASAVHELTDLRLFNPPGMAWSPDGSRVVYLAYTAVEPPNSLPSRALWIRGELWSAAADGSSPPQVLNGGFGLGALADAYGSGPSFTPDGTQLYFHHYPYDLWRMNPDGTCRQPVYEGSRLMQGPFWAPGASGGGPTACIDLATSVTYPFAVTGVGIGSPMTLTVENHGTLTAHDVVVRVQGADDATFSGCDPVAGCALGDIPARTARSIELTTSFARTGARELDFTASAAEENIRPADPTDDWVRVFACSVKGTPRRDHLVGTPRSEGICGRGGNDWIWGRANGDYLDGGAGNDTILGGLGRDTIIGGPGDDVIYAHDGIDDWIDCGPGNDVAHVDRYDVTVNCERVIRI